MAATGNVGGHLKKKKNPMRFGGFVFGLDARVGELGIDILGYTTCLDVLLEVRINSWDQWDIT